VKLGDITGAEEYDWDPNLPEHGGERRGALSGGLGGKSEWSGKSLRQVKTSEKGC